MPDTAVLVTQIVTKYQELDTLFSALVESDPAYKWAEALAFRVALMRQQVNDAVRGVLLASARRNDLDQIGANFQVQRLVITPADDSTIPPTPAVYEDDDAFRERIQLSWARLSTAGAKNAYHYFAQSADPDVLDVKAYGPETHSQEGRVFLYVLSRSGNGTASQPLLDKVAASVCDDETRPLTDFVSVRTAEIIPYDVVADIHIPYGLDGELVMANARKALQSYTDSVQEPFSDGAVEEGFISGDIVIDCKSYPGKTLRELGMISDRGTLIAYGRYGAYPTQRKEFDKYATSATFASWVQTTPPGRYLVVQYGGPYSKDIIEGVVFSGEVEIKMLETATHENQNRRDKFVIFNGVNQDVYCCEVRAGSTNIRWTCLSQNLTAIDGARWLYSIAGPWYDVPFRDVAVGGLTQAAYRAANTDEYTIKRGDSVSGSTLIQELAAAMAQAQVDRNDEIYRRQREMKEDLNNLEDLGSIRAFGIG